MFKALLGFPI